MLHLVLRCGTHTRMETSPDLVLCRGARATCRQERWPVSALCRNDRPPGSHTGTASSSFTSPQLGLVLARAVGWLQGQIPNANVRAGFESFFLESENHFSILADARVLALPFEAIRTFVRAPGRVSDDVPHERPYRYGTPAADRACRARTPAGALVGRSRARSGTRKGSRSWPTGDVTRRSRLSSRAHPDRCARDRPRRRSEIPWDLDARRR